MKLFSILMILGVSFNLQAAPPADYKLAWQDNFDGTQLDLTKWNIDTKTRDQAIQVPEASIVKNGMLTLKVFTENNLHYTSFLTTRDRYETAFGYYEAKIKFRSAPGEWCAFWLQTKTIGNPLNNPEKAGVEIDIVEHRLVNAKMQDISNYAGINLHWDGRSLLHFIS